jgi:hypothetical protein
LPRVFAGVVSASTGKVAGDYLFFSGVPHEIGDAILRGFTAVSAADSFTGTQKAKVIEEPLAFAILTLKDPKPFLRLSHALILTRVSSARRKANGAGASP